MKRSKNSKTAWTLLASLVGLGFGFVAVAQLEAQVRQQLPPGKDTNWVPPKFTGDDRAVIGTTQLHDVAAGQLTNLHPDDMVRELFCGDLPSGVAVANETFNGVGNPGPYPAGPPQEVSTRAVGFCLIRPIHRGRARSGFPRA